MGRKIVLCFDGTNNQYAATNTNVVKLYSMLDRTKDDQLTYYQPGIGTFAPPGVWGKFKKWFVTRIDLAIASLLDDHVCDGYRFLMRYYREGDEIFIFGFSRGAYSARVLAGMLHKVGLLTPGNEELISFAWDAYRRKPDQTADRGADIATGFQRTFSRPVRIRFLGLWDTVSSLGWIWHPKHLLFTLHNPSVDVVRHAVALDERRAQFVQNLWSEPSRDAAPIGAAEQDVLQVWFPGVHCDVGGGYVEKQAGLSKIALEWMLRQAESLGLRFNPEITAHTLPEQDLPDSAAPNAAAPIHESLHGWWWILEYVPKRVANPAKNFAKTWRIHAGRHRFVPDGSNIHQSVLDRIDQGLAYQPPNLPNDYTVIRNDGTPRHQIFGFASALPGVPTIGPAPPPPKK